MSTQDQALATRPQTSPLITELSDRWKMTPKTMIDTIKATVFPNNGKDVSDAQLMMLLQVAHRYDLSPFLRELYAFPTRGGGIVPMVPIDGWANIINRNPQMDGVDFLDEWEVDAATHKRSLFSTTCIIYRKDRSHPIKVTEYMQECFQPGKDPWIKFPARMLRHKSLIQCARIAFSLGGIYDPDEAERIAETGDKPEPAKPGRASAVIDAQPTKSVAGQDAMAGSSTAQQTAAGVSQAPAAATSEASSSPSQPQTKGEAATPSASPAPQGCICNCCKAGTCDCPSKDEMDQCGCTACLAAVKTPGPSASPSLSDIFNEPQGEVLPPSTKPSGPYVPQEKLKRLFVHAASANISIVKDSHDDELHKMLKAKWGIESLKEIPVTLFETILEEIAPQLKAAKAGKKK